MYPAIIDKDIFDKVQQKLVKNKRNGSSFRAKEKYILTGKFFCGECGEAMRPYAGISGSSKHALHRYYRCGGPRKAGCHGIVYPKNAVENAVVNVVTDYVFNHLDIEETLGQVMRAMTKINPEIERLESSLEETNKAIKNLTYALEKGLNLDEPIERLKELDCNKKALTEEINKYKIKDTVLTENQIRGFLSHLVNREYKDLNDGMYFINVFVNKILIYKNGRIVVILNIGDPDGGGELKKIVHQLSGQVHHLSFKSKSPGEGTLFL